MDKIPNGTTPIKHEILTEIFAKGLLSYNEMRIALFIIRWSWGFHKNQTREFTISEIARQIKINRGNCSFVINKMLKENKLLREENKYQFNEHYWEWKVFKKQTVGVGNLNSRCLKNKQKVFKKQTVGVRNLNSQPQTNPVENKPAENLKVFKSSKDIKIADSHLPTNENFLKKEVQPANEVYKLFETFYNLRNERYKRNHQSLTDIKLIPKGKELNFAKLLLKMKSLLYWEDVFKKINQVNGWHIDHCNTLSYFYGHYETDIKPEVRKAYLK